VVCGGVRVCERVGGAGGSKAAPWTFYRFVSGDGENPRRRPRLRARPADNASSVAAQCFYHYLKFSTLDGGDGATRDNDTAAATHTQ